MFKEQTGAWYGKEPGNSSKNRGSSTRSSIRISKPKSKSRLVISPTRFQGQAPWPVTQQTGGRGWNIPYPQQPTITSECVKETHWQVEKRGPKLTKPNLQKDIQAQLRVRIYKILLVITVWIFCLKHEASYPRQPRHLLGQKHHLERWEKAPLRAWP